MNERSDVHVATRGFRVAHPTVAIVIGRNACGKMALRTLNDESERMREYGVPRDIHARVMDSLRREIREQSAFGRRGLSQLGD